MKKLALILVFLTSAVSLMAAPYAFPVPFIATRHSNINFTDLPGEGTLKIYTVTGEQVFSLTLAPGQTSYPWPVTSSEGKKVATGVYIFIVEGGGQKTDGKVVVIR